MSLTSMESLIAIVALAAIVGDRHRSTFQAGRLNTLGQTAQSHSDRRRPIPHSLSFLLKFLAILMVTY